jgi:hypothetical protein
MQQNHDIHNIGYDDKKKLQDDDIVMESGA